MRSAEEHTTKLRRQIEREVYTLSKELSPDAGHLADLYSADPAETIRANLANVEYNIKMANRKAEEEIWGKARRAIPAESERGVCSNCQRPQPAPTNFCDGCGATFLTVEMVKNFKLIQNPIPQLRDLLGEVHNLQVGMDAIDPVDPASLAEVSGHDVAKFRIYLRNLGFTEDDFESGTVLDVGSGSRLFAGYCLREHINENVYSVDPENFPGASIPNNMEKSYLNKVLRPTERAILDLHTMRGVAERLPFPDQFFDRVLIHAGGQFADEAGQEYSTNNYPEIARVLKVGGEFRTNAHYVEVELHDEKSESAQHTLRMKAAEDLQLAELRNSGKYEITVKRETEPSDFRTQTVVFGLLIIKKLRS